MDFQEKQKMQKINKEITTVYRNTRAGEHVGVQTLINETGMYFLLRRSDGPRVYLENIDTGKCKTYDVEMFTEKGFISAIRDFIDECARAF